MPASYTINQNQHRFKPNPSSRRETKPNQTKAAAYLHLHLQPQSQSQAILATVPTNTKTRIGLGTVLWKYLDQKDEKHIYITPSLPRPSYLPLTHLKPASQVKPHIENLEPAKSTSRPLTRTAWSSVYTVFHDPTREHILNIDSARHFLPRGTKRDGPTS